MIPDPEIVDSMALYLLESVERFINNPTDENELKVLAGTIKLKNYVRLHTEEITEIGDDEDSADNDRFLTKLDKVMALKAELDSLIKNLPIYIKPFVCIFMLLHRVLYRSLYR